MHKPNLSLLFSYFLEKIIALIVWEGSICSLWLSEIDTLCSHVEPLLLFMEKMHSWRIKYIICV